MSLLRILLVEDNTELLMRMLRGLRTRLGDATELVTESDFDAAIARLAHEHFDAVVLDVRKGDPVSSTLDGDTEAGILCFQAIRSRRFVPVIFHTGLPSAVRDLQSPVVRVIEKSGHPSELADAVETLVKSGLPAVVRAMHNHVGRIQRDYMWDFGAKAWEQYGRARPEELAHLLARRLALSFDEAGVQELLREIGEVPGSIGEASAQPHTPQATSATGLHPVRMYVMPPLKTGVHNMGDLYSDSTGAVWVLLTPTCDMVCEGGRAAKVTEAVVTRCQLLSEQHEYKEWRESDSKGKTQALRNLLKNRREGKGVQPERFFFLPGVFELPDLIVDFSMISSISLGEVSAMRHLASLDAPFAAALHSAFQRYFGRFGTEDLDFDEVFRKLVWQSKEGR
jgi:CheY-like chemotaxis protein